MAKFGQKQGFEKKLVGLVSVRTGEKKAQFTLIEEGKTFKNGTNVFTTLLEDLPARPVLQPNDKSGRQQYRIRMNSDGDEVEALTPVVGVFDLELVDLGPRPEKDADPMPKEKVWNEGTPKENRYLEFFAAYEFDGGKFNGEKTPGYNLHYKFEEDSSNPGYAAFTFSLSNKQATRGAQLAYWGDLHGIWSVQGTDVEGEPIPWDDETILPTLLERALEHPKVRGVFKNGYISELLPREDEAGFESDEDVDIDDAKAVDDLLDGVEEVEVKSKAPKANGKVKSPSVDAQKKAKAFVKRANKKASEDDDDL